MCRVHFPTPLLNTSALANLYKLEPPVGGWVGGIVWVASLFGKALLFAKHADYSSPLRIRLGFSFHAIHGHGVPLF